MQRNKLGSNEFKNLGHQDVRPDLFEADLAIF